MKTYNIIFNQLCDQRNNFMNNHNKRMEELTKVLNNISSNNVNLDTEKLSSNNTTDSSIEDSLVSSIDESSKSLDDLLLEISNW